MKEKTIHTHLIHSATYTMPDLNCKSLN
jgi:hypothetical protein